ncbi:MAG: pyruvate carboxylase [Chloroflexi bacterium]|nr:pyruvate carboxylase [Chloroflexota bacterium]
MARRVGIMDVTLRDGQQSLWATRMPTCVMLGVADDLDRELKEDPWERLRLMRQRLQRTPINAWMRSRNFISFDMMPDDVMALVYTRLHANGARRISIFDGLHDMSHIGFGAKVCKQLGFYVALAVTFSISPVHTDAYYVRKAQELMAMGADALILKDPAGLLTVDRVRTLVPALRPVAGTRPLELHIHCLTGIGPLAALEAVELGVDEVHTAIPPLADGASHPSVFNIVENLRLMGYEVELDLEPLRQASAFLTAVARQERLPVGQVAQYDLFHYQHQIPGGVISNLRRQLRDAGMEDKLRAVLEEIPRVREELGWPIMVSPYSQFVSVQALLNIMCGERYRTVLDEVAKWAFGYYGQLEAPVDPQVMDKMAERASPRISRQPAPPEPLLPALRRAFPEADEDELVLRAFFKGRQVDDMLAAQPMNLVYEFRRDAVQLVERLMSMSETGRVALSTMGLELAWQR